jgi:hypothetical protein
MLSGSWKASPDVEHNILFTLPVQGKCSAGVSDSDSAPTGKGLILSTTTRDDKDDDDDNNDEKNEKSKCGNIKKTLIDQQKKRSNKISCAKCMYAHVSCTYKRSAVQPWALLAEHRPSYSLGPQVSWSCMHLSCQIQRKQHQAWSLSQKKSGLQQQRCVLVTHFSSMQHMASVSSMPFQNSRIITKREGRAQAASAYFKLNVAFQIASWRKTPQMWCSGPRGPKAWLDCSAASIISTSPLLPSRTTPRRYHDLPAAVRPAANRRSCPWFLCRIIGDIRLG